MSGSTSAHDVAGQPPARRLMHEEVLRPLREALQVEVEVAYSRQVVQVDVVEAEHVVRREPADGRHCDALPDEHREWGGGCGVGGRGAGSSEKTLAEKVGERGGGGVVLVVSGD